MDELESGPIKENEENLKHEEETILRKRKRGGEEEAPLHIVPLSDVTCQDQSYYEPEKTPLHPPPGTPSSGTPPNPAETKERATLSKKHSKKKKTAGPQWDFHSALHMLGTYTPYLNPFSWPARYARYREDNPLTNEQKKNQRQGITIVIFLLCGPLLVLMARLIRPHYNSVTSGKALIEISIPFDKALPLRYSDWTDYYGNNSQCTPVTLIDDEDVVSTKKDNILVFENETTRAVMSLEHLKSVSIWYLISNKERFVTPRMFLNMSAPNYHPPCICTIRLEGGTVPTFEFLVNPTVVKTKAGTTTTTKKEVSYSSDIIREDSARQIMKFPETVTVIFESLNSFSTEEGDNVPKRVFRDSDSASILLCLKYMRTTAGPKSVGE